MPHVELALFHCDYGFNVLSPAIIMPDLDGQIGGRARLKCVRNLKKAGKKRTDEATAVERYDINRELLSCWSADNNRVQVLQCRMGNQLVQIQ